MTSGSARGVAAALFFFGFVIAGSASAQQSELSLNSPLLSKKFIEYGTTAGTLLPFGIFGVRSAYDMVGFRLGHRLRFWRVEWSFFGANDEGVTFYTGSLSARGAIDLDVLKLVLLVGPDLHYYKPRPTNIRELPYTMTGGMHVGISPMFEIQDPWYLRADFKMGFGPGQTLYAGVGLSYVDRNEGKDDDSGKK